MISAVAWIPSGIARKEPINSANNEEEYNQMCQMAKHQLRIAQDELASTMDGMQEKPTMNGDIPDDLADFDLENYDKEENATPDVFSTAVDDLMAFENEDDDPYITLKEDDQDDKDDVEIKETDNLIAVAKTEEDLSVLEVCVFDPLSDSVYVHHDLMLPSFPICLEPIHAEMNEGRNFIAVGSFESSIEIWDLDVLDSLFPYAVLGSDKKLKKDKKKAKKSKVSGHSDAVLSISWNPLAQNLLLSAGADGMIILWDLMKQKVVRHFSVHQDKVSCVHWHPSEPSVFVSGGYDRRICYVDAKLDEALVFEILVDSDIECISFDRHSCLHGKTGFVVGVDSGDVFYFEVSADGIQKKVQISAHSSSVTSAQVHPHIRGMLLTTGAESTEACKLWDLFSDSSCANFKPTMVASREIRAGKIFSGSFCPSDPYYIAAGGSLGTLSIWNFTDSDDVCTRFNGREGQSGICKMDLQGSIAMGSGRALMSVGDASAVEIDRDDSSSDEDSDSNEMEETIEEMGGVQ